jgi:hypothetical protein
MSAPAEFAGRVRIPFDDFYDRYYAAENVGGSSSTTIWSMFRNSAVFLPNCFAPRIVSTHCRKRPLTAAGFSSKK